MALSELEGADERRKMSGGGPPSYLFIQPIFRDSPIGKVLTENEIKVM